MRKINAEGIALIKQWEGLRLKAYKCEANVLTIGYGHTTNVTEDMQITEEEAEQLLLRDISVFEAEVSRSVTVKISDNQFAALVSWAFNVGVGAMRKSSLIRKLNAGDYASVPSELARWNKAKGKVVAGLSNRRAAEAGLWARGSFVSSRGVEPVAPNENSKAAEAGKLGGVAAAAATASPAIMGLSDVHWAVGVSLVFGVVAVATVWFLKKRET
jgi:lysozyme